MDKLGKVPSTQEHLDIEDIRDDTIILKNGSATAVLQTTAVNFDLLSETEQDSLIFAFAALLNSLTFPIQILIRTKRMDVSNYLIRVQQAKGRSHNQNLVAQIEKYEKFIKDLVSKNQVLDKRFYVAIPHIGVDLSQVTSNIASLFKHKSPNMDKWALLEKAKVNLDPKVEHLIKQFNRLGVRTVRLNTEELIELFYDLYNPEIAREEKAALGPKEYTTPIVEPSLAPVVGEQSQPSQPDQSQQTTPTSQVDRPLRTEHVRSPQPVEPPSENVQDFTLAQKSEPQATMKAVPQEHEKASKPKKEPALHQKGAHKK
jgi:hypothetical protein